MAGINDLTAQILLDAEEKAAGIKADAAARAEEVIGASKEEAAAASQTALARARKEADDYAARIRSQIGMQKRQDSLKAKQDVIELVIGKAYESLKDQDDPSYFALITRLVEKNAHKEDGEILLSQKDLARLSADAKKNLEDAAGKNGGTLTVSQEAADIEDGFVLRYGGIEENCTLKALFSEKQEAIRDKVQAVLWPRN